jgi:hypothetical protein
MGESAGRMATTFTAGRYADMTTVPAPRSARIFRILLVIFFIAAHVTALAHEFEHVLHQHEAPCALHVAADHLAMATAPVPALAVSPAPLPGKLAPSQVARLPLQARSAAARAPPHPA